MAVYIRQTVSCLFLIFGGLIAHGQTSLSHWYLFQGYGTLEETDIKSILETGRTFCGDCTFRHNEKNKTFTLISTSEIDTEALIMSLNDQGYYLSQTEGNSQPGDNPIPVRCTAAYQKLLFSIEQPQDYEAQQQGLILIPSSAFELLPEEKKQALIQRGNYQLTD
jgi:hypothetical protein